MNRRKQRNEPLAVNPGLERQVDAHHADGEDVDEHVHQGEHLGHEIRRLTRDLIVERTEQRVVARLPHIAEGRESGDETVDPGFPAFDVLGKNRHQAPRLLDYRWHQQGEKPEQRHSRQKNGEEERELGWKADVLDQEVAHGAEI